MKSFLLIDSLGESNEFITRLAGVLIKDDWQALLLAKPNSPLAQTWREADWLQKVWRWWPKNWFIMIILSPLFWVLMAGRFLVYKKRWSIKSVVCLGLPAKILVTPMARLLGLKVIWLELPNFNYEALSKNNLKMFRSLATKARVVCFSLATKLALLAIGVAEEKITLIWPGVEATEFQQQSDLFQNLAKQNLSSPLKKFFTIGTVIDFREPQRTEILIRSIKEALLIVPNLRLIIIGEGSAREQALWLSKQLDVERSVWLVGSQNDLKKWYANFDLFVVASSTPGLDDWLVALGAMVNGVPVIAPQGLSLEDCFLGGKAGILLSLEDHEELAATIINLEQDNVLRKNLSINARRVAKDFFALSRAKDEFKAIL